MITIIVRQPRPGQFSVSYEGGNLLGTTDDEAKAIWGAILVADVLAEGGQRATVVSERGSVRTLEHITKQYLRVQAI